MDAPTPKTKSSSKFPRFSLRALLIVIVIVAFSINSLTWIRSWIDPFAGRYFDRELWHRFHEDHDPDNPRASMVTDLQWNHLKKGMTRSDIEELLGTPDFEKRDDIYSYNLGMWSGFRMDYDSLDIHFDADGKLADIRRLQH